MKIAINTLSVTPSCGGIRTYLVETLRSLLRLDDGSRYLLIGAGLNRALLRPFVVAGRMDLVEVALPRDWKWLRVWQEQMAIPRVLEAWGAEALLSPVGVATLRTECPQVVVMQHPFWRPYLDLLPLARRKYLEWFVPRSLRKASRVVGVSKTILDHLVEEGLVDPGKGEVIPYGVNRHALFERSAPREILDRVGSGYYLFVGDLYPYKGVERILEAMTLLRRNLGLDRDLVVVGRDHWGQAARLRARVRDLGLERRVHFLGEVEHGRLGWIYEQAFCLILPSELETFGMPLVEAMTCGTPVVASDRTALPEVVGNAGMIVSPSRTGEFVAALRRLEEPSVRATYVKRGHERAARFDWDTAAAETLAVCRRAAGLAPAEAPAQPIRQRATTPR